MRKPAPPSRQSLLNEITGFGRQFYERRWMWGTAGNLSVKLRQKPLELAITPSGLDKGALSPADLIILNEKASERGKKPAPGSPPPSAETTIHRAIYEARPGCGAVFHVHPIYATLISGLYGHPTQRRMLQVEWFEMMKGLGVEEAEIGQIPIFPNWQDVARVANDLRQFLQESPKPLPVALIYNHGMTAWGRTMQEARSHLEIVEYVCEYLYLKRLVKV